MEDDLQTINIVLEYVDRYSHEEIIELTHWINSIHPDLIVYICQHLMYKIKTKHMRLLMIIDSVEDKMNYSPYFEYEIENIVKNNWIIDGDYELQKKNQDGFEKTILCGEEIKVHDPLEIILKINDFLLDKSGDNIVKKIYQSRLNNYEKWLDTLPTEFICCALSSGIDFSDNYNNVKRAKQEFL